MHMLSALLYHPEIVYIQLFKQVDHSKSYRLRYTKSVTYAALLNTFYRRRDEFEKSSHRELEDDSERWYHHRKEFSLIYVIGGDNFKQYSDQNK